VALGASPLTRHTLLTPLPAGRQGDFAASDATPCALEVTVELAVLALAATRPHPRTQPHSSGTTASALHLAGLYVHVAGAVLGAGALSAVTVAVEPEPSQETHTASASAPHEPEVQSRAAAVTWAATAASATTRLAEALASASTCGDAAVLSDLLTDWCGGWDAWPQAVVAPPLGVSALAYWYINPPAPIVSFRGPP
jgi:hypothetical protein